MLSNVKVGLFDGCFKHQKSATLGGDNASLAPRYVSWERDEHLPVTFYTDTNLEKVLEAPSWERSYAWLIEPPSISDTHYRRAAELKNRFARVLSFHGEGLFYPVGGLWIDVGWTGLTEKTRGVSMFVSEKRAASGHKLRYAFLPDAAKYKVDVFGREVNPVYSKYPALAPYRFSIVIESCKLERYFTEKLIDCFAVGTIPIYWGASKIGEFFDERGILSFETLDDLHAILATLSTDDYIARFEAVKRNMEIAQLYYCAEDWIYTHYTELFA